MDNEINKEYIEKAINELIKFFGIKESIKDKDILKKISDKQIKEAIKLIAHQFGLLINVNINIVPDNYKDQQDINNKFQSSHLVRVNQHGYENEGIIAQVLIPKNLPLYGLSELNNYPINVKISRNCIKFPTTFLMIMAHELSHLLMYSVRHPEKEHEFYTDILAMILGFSDIFKKGRKNITIKESNEFLGNKIMTITTTYGYLNDDQFSFAYKKIKSILKKNWERKNLLLKELNLFNQLLLEYEKNIFKFKKFLEYLTKNRINKISIDDIKKITIFFNPGYLDNFDLIIKKYKIQNKKIEDFSKKIFHYTEQKIDKIISYTNNLKIYQNELKNKIFSLKRDIKILGKYINIKYKIKIFLFAFFRKKLSEFN